MITIEAYAKINLTLEVLGKRPDEFHDIRSVVQTVSLNDTITLESALHTVYKSGRSELSDVSDWSAAKSLIVKAVELSKESAGTNRGVSIDIIKHIPLVSGLGGDSSDAAAVLKGLNKLWELDLADDTLHQMAARLGSDVPFFLYGGTALMAGRGDQITLLPAVVKTWVVLIIPKIPRPPQKTARLYGALQPGHYTDGGITARLVAALKQSRQLQPELLFNTFENVVFDQFSELAVYRQHILKLGAGNLHLAGSGPAMFSIVKDEDEGRELCERLQSPGLIVHLAYTLN